MRRHSRKIIAAGVCLALAVGLLGTAVAAGKPPASNDNLAFTVWNVLHSVFRGVRGEVRRLGFAVEKLGSAVVELQGEFIDLDTRVDEVEILSQRVEDLEKMVLALEFGIDDLADLANILPPIQDFDEQLRGCIRIFDGDIGGLPGPHVLFEGCNVHVRSGELATDATVNGRGNLLVGYNEGRCVASDPETVSCTVDGLCDENEMCLDGACRDRLVRLPEPFVFREGTSCFTDDECRNPGLVCDLSRRGGSHNLIVGDGHRYSSYAGVAAGRRALIGAPFASVCGGIDNRVLADYGTISGGRSNLVTGAKSSLARGIASSISGGTLNTARGFGSSILGGRENTAGMTLGAGEGADDFHTFGATVSGGHSNEAIASYSSISGGRANSSARDGDYSSISGGESNEAQGEFSSVSGGFDREAVGIHDWVAGGASEDN